MSYKNYEDVASATLKSYTTPVKELIDEGVDDVEKFIAYCARVSNPAGQLAEERDDARLIKYLTTHKHWSPLEMANAVIEINTTRDIGRQILRHRSASFQEFSQRYAEVVSADESRGLQFVLREARLQDDKNRQNSIDLDDAADANDVRSNWKILQIANIDTSKATYEWAINAGVAKEQARVVLPEGNTMTRMYMNMSIRSWVHFIELRSGNGTQKENMMIARACAKAISKIFPSITDYVNE